MNNIKIGTMVEGELKLNGDLTTDAGFINSAKVIRTIAPVPGHHADTLITKGYAETYFVRNNVDDTMTGNLTIEKTAPFLRINSDSGNDVSILMRENGDQVAYIFHHSTTSALRLQKRNAAGAALNEIQIQETKTTMSKPLEVAGNITTTSNAAAVIVNTTSASGNIVMKIGGVQYGGVTQSSSALSLNKFNSSETLLSRLLVTDGETRVTNPNAILSLQPSAAGQSSNLQFKSEAGNIQGDLYVEGAGDKRVIMRKRDGGTVTSTIVMSDDNIRLNSRLIVDDSISSQGLIISDAANANPRIETNSTGADWSGYRSNVDGNHRGLLYTSASWVRLRYYNASPLYSSNAEIELSENRIDLNTGNVGTTGDLVIKNVGPILTLSSTDATSDCIFRISQNLVVKAQIYYREEEDRLILSKHSHGSTTGGAISIYDDYIFAKAVRTNAFVGGESAGTLTPKGYVDDNENVVQQANGYSMVMPTAAGTVGQQLQVISVSGTVLTMGWV